MDKETSIPYTGYKISRDKVIYTTVYNELRYTLPVENADPATFEILSSMYGKDKYYVFWMSQVIERADPETFEVL
ncbi:MAG: DKNYY domain-containing protein, partial [Cytophagales bacterium]|nr:DKNYY domain-containing protein [Cytophagales bacterium]